MYLLIPKTTIGTLIKNIYTAVESLGSVGFFMFFKEVSYAHQGCIYLIKNTEKK